MNTRDAPFRKALLVIVTFNSFDSLPDIAATIRDFERAHPGHHVAVVENSSDLRVAEYIQNHYESDRILVETPSHNEGFSHGVNLGYALAKGLWGPFDFVILLNPDVISAGRVVCELVDRAAISSHLPSKTGVWGVVLRDCDGMVDRGCARRRWNRRRYFSHLVGYDGFASALLTPPRNLTSYEIENDQRDLAMVSGAMMCIGAQVLKDGLDTVLPMYLEDQEICMRSLSGGSAIVLYPDLEALHVGGVSRKALTDQDHALRIMELVEAPVQCMARLQGYSVLPLRALTLFGGITRMVAAPLAAGFKVLFRGAKFDEQIRWILLQQRLATWFVNWALSGRLHDQPVPLSEYFQEYASVQS